MSDKFHLGWFVDGFRVPAWNRDWSGTSTQDWVSGRFYVDMARDLERGCFDYIMLEDSNYVPDVYGGSTEVYLKYGQRAPKHDPAVLATLIAAATSNLGIITTLATTEISPFRLARLMQTLDGVSGGRIGWNVVTGSNDRAAQNFGFEAQPPHDQRYDMADEFIQAVRALWDSWEDGAVIADVESNVYVDASKVSDVDFEGTYYRTRGPLNTIPGPQKHPILVQAGVSPRGQKFAARHADSVIATGSSIDGMRELRASIKQHAADAGRNPDDVKVLFLVEPILGETDEDARARQQRVAAERDRLLDFGLSSLASVTATDFSTFDPDEPLPLGLTTNGHQGQLADMVRSRRPLRELAVGAWAGSDEADLVGTPATVAAKMAGLMDEVGGDGFLLTSLNPTRRYVTEVVDGLVPELQRLGRVRTEYAQPTVRGTLTEF
ncbi:NtaA/DmoA family FMN-dependent monooxygenase [Herbiconiux moechotypicola]|uniref:NtaA/DmoA family FMN-dependent monooxygenase n=1 Tax=Herbiconiux moechotypicola TaxID=637393 RepID=A0ABP5QFF4_9MICO|nr:NtaA/DmoA family FMN-dependent monooxygenase [Herbiconiux moechotypicola]MCS5730006.1 NtaA/DmoA family FMN-dependent monooxygenase [Herbiconiux moechotypicola]